MAHKPIMINVVNQAKEPIKTGVMCWVVDAGTCTPSTLYAKASGTALVNPISAVQYAADGGHVQFFTSTAGGHDLILTNGKGVVVLENITPNTRELACLDEMPGIKVLPIPINSLTGANSTAEIDDGFDFPINAEVLDISARTLINVKGSGTLDAGLLAAGTSGDANGFIAAIGMTDVGVKDLGPLTTSNTERYMTACYYGDLLADFIAGADAGGDVGTYLKRKKRILAAACSLSYTMTVAEITGQLVVSYLYPGDNF